MKSGSISYDVFDSVGVTRSIVVGSVGRSVDTGDDVNDGGELMMMQLLLMVQQRPIDGVNYDGGGY